MIKIRSLNLMNEKLKNIFFRVIISAGVFGFLLGYLVGRSI